MSKREYLLTAEGATKIREELVTLRGPRREAIAARLRNAVQMGDLSENADYIVAKEDQAFLEGRIQELETILREAVIVGEVEAGIAGVGSTVVVSEGGGPPETFYLVGNKEADPRQGRISHESPIGLALIGHKAGDIVTAATPGGTLTFTLLEVR
jgi:transcription elongation factor GreA